MPVSIIPISQSAQRLNGAGSDSIANARDSQLQQAAEQFEAIFLQQVLKQMRKAGDALASDSSMRSREMDVMRDFYDGALAESMAGQHQTGIADMLVRQLSGNQGQMMSSEAASQMARNADIPARTGSPREVLPNPWQQGLDGFNVLVNSVVRHESAGQVDAISAKGARGVMQLMPETAREMATELGLPFNEKWLTQDAHYNKRLGTAYLDKMLTRYDGEPALAVAAYNAGPGKVDEWLTTLGDPRRGDLPMTEWLEQIPYQETRNYTRKILKDLSQAGVTTPEHFAVVAFKSGTDQVALHERTHLNSAAFAQPVRFERPENKL